MSNKLDIPTVLKIKGMNHYLNKNKMLFNTYEDLINNSIESFSELSLGERKKLLATYLLTFGLSNSLKLMEELNYLNFNEYSKDLVNILQESMSNDLNQTIANNNEQLLSLIVSHIINNYILDDEAKTEIFEFLTIEDGEESRFLSFNKLKPIIIEQMTKFNFFEDIHLIIENVIIEFRKIDALEFIDREAIEKYEIYYKLKEDIEIKEILYKL